MTTIDIRTETAQLGVCLGLMSLGSDGVYDLTPEGEAWLDEWLGRKLDELQRKEST